MLSAIVTSENRWIPAILLGVAWIFAAPLLIGYLMRELRRLEERVARLERQGIPAAPPVSHAVTPAPAAQTPPGAAPATLPSRPLDWEGLLAGRWLNRIGIIALLFGVAFFLRYAFQNGWIGPAGRVLTGLIAGTLLLAWSGRLVHRGYRYFGDGIAALGAAVLYLSLYAAWGFYHLVVQQLAFSGMVIVTAALTGVAWRRGSRGLILIAQVGGLLTPALLDTGRDQHLALFLYLLILNLAFLLLAERQRRQAPLWVGWLASTAYFATWYASYYRSPLLAVTISFLLLVFVLFLFPAGLRAMGRVREGARGELAVLATLVLVVELIFPLWPGHRGLLTTIALATVAALAFWLWASRERGGSRPDRAALAAMAIVLLTLAVPFRFDGRWIPTLWSLEALLLIERGFAHRLRGLRVAGLLIFIPVVVRLLVSTARLGSHRLFWNQRFEVFAVAVACGAAALGLSARHSEECSDDERTGFAILHVIVHLLALVGLAHEVWDALRRAAARGALDRELAPQLGLSLLWTLYASGLMVAGVRGRVRLLRWLALILFGLVIGKVFLYDLSSLSSGYRILSFLVLGSLLLAVSFLYQRRAGDAGKEKGEPPPGQG